jgi:hypothetical protein
MLIYLMFKITASFQQHGDDALHTSPLRTK